MQKKRRLHSFIILSVIALTVYNILPTLFYYSKPLKAPIDAPAASKISVSIADRVNDLEKEHADWIQSFCNLLKIKPQSVVFQSENPELISVSFIKSEEAAQFRRFFPRAGALIPFSPAQLSLWPQTELGKEVLVQRKIPIHLESAHFSFVPKEDLKVVKDRLQHLALALTEPSEAANYVKEHLPHFSNRTPLNPDLIHRMVDDSSVLDLSNRHPLFSKLFLDQEKDQIVLKLQPEIASFRTDNAFEQLFINEMARIGRFCNEKLAALEDEIHISLYKAPNVSGSLVLDLEKIVETQQNQLKASLHSLWHPKHPDLQNLSIIDLKTYEALPAQEKALCLVAISPLRASRGFIDGLQNDSIYLAAKGFDKLIQSYKSFADSELAQSLNADLQMLQELLYENGFILHRKFQGSKDLIKPEDFVFEKGKWAESLLSATRENFIVRGTKKYAALELTDHEALILTQNKIETAIHEDLLKWNDEYRSAQISIDGRNHVLDVPKPTRSPFWSNYLLSFKKFIRGDERKIIRWGLDLSGGKTVQIALEDQNHQLITDDEAIRQGINELYVRVNKIGLSEVSIRQIGPHIVLDFPSSQALSASELIQASSMYFHIVNEQFSSFNDSLSQSADRFLQEVWNKASLLEQKDSVHINAIAYSHLHDENQRSQAAQALWENGLRLASPKEPSATNNVETSLSKIAILRESNPQTHPLLIVFNNYVIEGSNLQNIRASYDQTKGNSLNFEVKDAYSTKNNQTVDPQKALHSWSSLFSQETIAEGPLEKYSKGRGWRMAVLLNDTVISAPTLNSPLETGGMISGSFSQREVHQLAADLKGGSLSFTPHILSEKNVSPELGKEDRIKGISATWIAFILVVAAMIAYYRFAGFVASVAVFFNLLILWATLQNLGATLTLAGIAGIILTVGMAVDANVLVFERVKEEFALSGRIGSALAVGYQKAYSAIIDSNITTIIAALILLNFDAGPIKSFAINLIIGIVSSMFTALFMTRFYFTKWAENPKNKELKMAAWIENTKINFLKYAKRASFASLAIIIGGSFCIIQQRSSIFGIDFTGGYAVHLELASPADATQSWVHEVENALISSGASLSDFQVRELSPKNHLRVLFGTSMEKEGKPFFRLPLQSPSQSSSKNLAVDWVVDALQKKNLALSAHCLSQLDANWTSMSGQMSDTMRNNAMIGLLISFVSIFIYLSFRFEYKFAAAALICLLHDVLITIGAVGLIHALKIPIQIDLNTIAALMTIIGYSLNDTIIIFDRIREETHLKKHLHFAELVNSALNTTLSRTTITSGTTLLVLIALVIFGGPSIFGFSLVMAIGVFFGTVSSWFIASPLLLFFQKKEELSPDIRPLA